MFFCFYFFYLQALTVTKRCSERGQFLGWPRVAIVIVCLESFLTITLVILILQLMVVFHGSTIVLSTSTVYETMVLIKSKLKWNGDFRSTRYGTGREDSKAELPTEEKVPDLRRQEKPININRLFRATS